MTEETAAFVVGKTAYPIPVTLARLLRRVEGADKSWRPELETVLEWLGKPESTPPATPPQWEQVEVFGHQKHVGIVTEIEELGAHFLRIEVPAYTYQRRRYSARVVKVGAAAIFRRIACSETEAQTRLGYQTNLFDGEPLPGLLVEEARHRLGPTSDRAAELLGMPREEYAAIERCAVDIDGARAQQIIADLAAAWVAAKAAQDASDEIPPGMAVDYDICNDCWRWSCNGIEGGVARYRHEAIADAREYYESTVDDDEVPSNATAEAPAAEDIERLDFSKPPPGYDVWHDDGARSDGVPGTEYRNDDAVGWYFSDAADVVYNDGKPLSWPNEAVAAAWAHYKQRHDPPGMLLWAASLMRSTLAADEDGIRAAAWVWYEQRLALAGLLESEEIDRRLTEHHPEISTTRLCRGWWPAILTWPDGQVAAVERWLTDSTAEMPEVLRG